VRAIEHVVNFEGAENIAAFIGEPIQGAGGIIIPPKEYWSMVKEICEKNDILLIIDEIMSGFGRTGKFFAIEHWNVKPDIMTIGKGLTSGYLPFSAVCAVPKISESFWADPEENKAFMTGHTWGQECPLLCVAASACIDVMLKERIPERAAEMGDYLMKRLKELEDMSIVGDIRGKGLFTTVELVKDKKTKELLPTELTEWIEDTCWKRGLAAWCRFPTNFFNCPPLIITKDQIDKGIDIITGVLEEAAKKT